MSRKRMICMIAAAVISACMAAGILLDYIVIDFSKMADILGLPDISFAGSVIGFFSGRNNAVTMSGLILLKNLVNGTSADYPGGMDRLLGICTVLTGVPYLICIVTLALSFVRRLWSYIVTIVMAAVGEIAVIGGLTFILPKAVSAHIHSLLDIGLVSEGSIRSVLWQGVGPAWWILAVGFALLIILSVIGMTGGEETQKRQGYVPEDAAYGFSSVPSRPGSSFGAESGISEGRSGGEIGFICEFGPLDGVQIPLNPGEPVLIGSDPARCQMVVDDPGVESVHCEILWNGEYSMYEIRDESDSGVYLMGRKVGRGERAGANHGDVLCLGDGSRRIYLI